MRVVEGVKDDTEDFEDNTSGGNFEGTVNDADDTDESSR